VLLDRDALDRRSGALVLDVLHGRRGSFGHVDRAAAQHRAAGGKRCEFNQSHPY